MTTQQKDMYSIWLQTNIPLIYGKKEKDRSPLLNVRNI
jgi:hypothetical protein